MTIDLNELANRKPEGIVLTDEPGQGYVDRILITEPERTALLAVVQAALEYVAYGPTLDENSGESAEHIQEFHNASDRLRESLASYET